jgi:hypothetical protein
MRLSIHEDHRVNRWKPCRAAHSGDPCRFQQVRFPRGGADIACKVGHRAKNGGTLGHAPIGCLNTIKRFEGQEVRSISIDEESAPFMKLAFELCVSGDHTRDDSASQLTDRGLITRGNVRRAPLPSIDQQRRRLRPGTYRTGA